MRQSQQFRDYRLAAHEDRQRARRPQAAHARRPGARAPVHQSPGECSNAVCFVFVHGVVFFFCSLFGCAFVLTSLLSTRRMCTWRFCIGIWKRAVLAGDAISRDKIGRNFVLVFRRVTFEVQVDTIEYTCRRFAIVRFVRCWYFRRISGEGENSSLCSIYADGIKMLKMCRVTQEFSSVLGKLLCIQCVLRICSAFCVIGFHATCENLLLF